MQRLLSFKKQLPCIFSKYRAEFGLVSGNWFVVFRILFGLLLFGSTIRFWLNGWIESLYILPTFHFKYYGFEWVQCPSPSILYFLFIIQAISALGFAVNLFPNYAIGAFFLSFTYVELIDVTPYLNHYYLVSVLSFLLVVALRPKHNSLDSAKTNYPYSSKVGLFCIKLVLSLVYFYGGIAKLNSDWLLEAQPLRLWLIGKSDMPYIGDWLLKPETAYFAACFGCVFDLCVPFLLWNRRTILFAYLLLSIFHITTALLFPIGVFPWVMMIGTLLFFEDSHTLLKTPLPASLEILPHFYSGVKGLEVTRTLILALLILILILLPLRQYCYKENRLWTEQGFRFAWNIMLIEKRAMIDFKVTDSSNNHSYGIDLKKHLTDFQIIMMRTQPDLILQFAHHLANEARIKGIINPKVSAECYVSLNGRPSQLYFDPNLDLTKIYDTFAPRLWLYPLANE